MFTRVRGADVSFRDVTIKSQIENMTRDVSDVTHRKRGLRFEKSQLVDFCLGGRRLTFARLPRPCGRCRTWLGGGEMEKSV